MRHPIQDPTRLSPLDRIILHLRCPWRTSREARFHIAGILREFGIHWIR